MILLAKEDQITDNLELIFKASQELPYENEIRKLERGYRKTVNEKRKRGKEEVSSLRKGF